MLVLTRREGEGLSIGNDVRVTVLIIFEKRIKLQLNDLENKVITCRLGATTPIRGDISIEVVDIDRKQVKLGIKAPKDMEIDREEAVGYVKLGINAPESMKVDRRDE